MDRRGWMRKLEKRAHGKTYVIPQKDGPPKMFPKSEYRAACENAWRQMGAGEDVPPMHPMITAALNSSDPEWRRYFLFWDDPDWRHRSGPGS
jgi:hypothetical protein